LQAVLFNNVDVVLGLYQDQKFLPAVSWGMAKAACASVHTACQYVSACRHARLSLTCVCIHQSVVVCSSAV
jgi:hypothetical protein